MKTDDLISILGRNAEPVPEGRVERAVVVAIGIGAAAALLATLAVLGYREGIERFAVLGVLLLKLAFTVTTGALAAFYLMKLARPGGEGRAPLMLAVAPLIGVIVLAAVVVASAPATHWHGMIVGHRWLECLISIPIIAILPFAAIVWAVRRMAPTDLTRAERWLGCWPAASARPGMRCTVPTTRCRSLQSGTAAQSRSAPLPARSWARGSCAGRRHSTASGRCAAKGLNFGMGSRAVTDRLGRANCLDSDGLRRPQLDDARLLSPKVTN